MCEQFFIYLSFPWALKAEELGYTRDGYPSWEQ